MLPDRIRTHFWPVSALAFAHKGAPKRAARASGAGGTFWGTFVGEFQGGSEPKMGPNPARKDNYSQRKDY